MTKEYYHWQLVMVCHNTLMILYYYTDNSKNKNTTKFAIQIECTKVGKIEYQNHNSVTFK